MLQHYFVSAWVPNPDQSHNYFARERNGNYLAGFVSPSIDVAPGQQGSTSASFYVGPKIQGMLEQVGAPGVETPFVEQLGVSENRETREKLLLGLIH